MPPTTLATLQAARTRQHRRCLDLCLDYAQAVVWGLPRRARREALDAAYDTLAALDLAIASYDPQQGLFLDEGR